MSKIESLDWNIRRGIHGVTDSMAEPLLRYEIHQGKAQLVPALAQKWWSEQNGKVWYFQIREGLRWSDGEPFHPQSLLDSLERILRPETGSIYITYFTKWIKGAQRFSS
ncbi:MAG: ABC transporter substrate-binding protein, partial [Pseudomonadota bacterium]